MFDGILLNYEVSAQAVWEKVTNHLLQQGVASVSNMTGGCAYYGEDGTKCAIGVLIPKEEYTPNVEGVPIRNLFDKYYCPPSLLKLRECSDLLDELQRAHDVYYNRKTLRKEWYLRLVNIGRQYQLDTSSIEKKWKSQLSMNY